MASYSQLNEIFTDTAAGAQELREKVRVACAIAAETIISNSDTTDPPWSQTAGDHDQRVKWAVNFLASPDTITREMFIVVIAANSSASQSAILNASDGAIQTNVNESIDSLAANLV